MPWESLRDCFYFLKKYLKISFSHDKSIEKGNLSKIVFWFCFVHPKKKKRAAMLQILLYCLRSDAKTKTRCYITSRERERERESDY